MDGQKQDNVKNKAISGLFWTLMERVGAQGVQLIVSIVLARLIAPEEFGELALIIVFTNILGVFIDSGFGNALIQKKDADDLDFSSVFYFNVTMCSVLYILMFFAAPYIARFYKMPDLVAPIRVISLTFLISGVKNVQYAYVSRNMQFKRFFFATLGGTVGAAILGIWMAYKGYGIWALIAQSLFNNTVDTIILWLTVKWRPKLMFSFERLKGLFSYGWKLLVSSLIDMIYNNLREMIIGKMYKASSLAFYDKGSVFPRTIIVNVNSAINSVLFPVMSDAQDSTYAVKMMTRRAITTSSYVIWPMMMGLAACAEPLVRILLTDKWLPCVPFLRVFCIVYAFWPIHTANLNAIKALGRSDLFLKLEIIKKIVGLAVLAATMWFGPLVMAYSLLFTSIISQIINAWPNRRLLNYTYVQQLMDILPSILLSGFMFGVVYSVKMLNFNNWLTLLIQIPVGIAIYIAGSKLFRIESFDYVLTTAKAILKRG